MKKDLSNKNDLENSDNNNNIINVGGEIVQNLDELNENNKNEQYSDLNNPPANFKGFDNASKKPKNNDKYEKFYDEV